MYLFIHAINIYNDLNIHDEHVFNFWGDNNCPDIMMKNKANLIILWKNCNTWQNYFLEKIQNVVKAKARLFGPTNM